LNSAMTGSAEDCIKPLPGDHRFDHPGWQQFPFNVIYQGFLLNQQWWHNATTGIRGVSKHSEAAVWFIAKQILDMMAPANMPAMNPEIVEATIKERGANLTRGAQHYAEDFRRSLRISAARYATKSQPVSRPFKLARTLRSHPVRSSSAIN